MGWQLFPILVLAAFQPTRVNAPTCDSVCGNRPLALSRGSSLRLIGGTDALPGTWPWTVSFQFPTRKGWSHFCGGSLINSLWVITSAHCFLIKKFLKVEYFRVQLGATQRSNPGPDAQVRKIKRLVEHEHFQARMHINDICLVELSEPVDCNNYIQPACLPDLSLRRSTLKDCFICGWGIKDLKSKRADDTDILQEAAVELLPTDVCNSSGWYYTGIRDENICAISDEANIDNCRGDGGGPLMCKEERLQRFWVIGINSWGRGCKIRADAGVFTSTQSYYHWIQRTLNNPPQSGLIPPFKPTPPPRPTTHSIYPVFGWKNGKMDWFYPTSEYTGPALYNYPMVIHSPTTKRGFFWRTPTRPTRPTRKTWAMTPRPFTGTTRWIGSTSPAWFFRTLPPTNRSLPTHTIIRGTKIIRSTTMIESTKSIQSTNKWVRPSWVPPRYSWQYYMPRWPWKRPGGPLQP